MNNYTTPDLINYADYPPTTSPPILTSRRESVRWRLVAKDLIVFYAVVCVSVFLVDEFDISLTN